MSENNGEIKKTLLIEKDKNSEYLMKLTKEVVFNSDCPIQDRYEGLMILLDNARVKKQKIEYGIRRMEMYLNSLYEKALQQHKQKKIVDFTERWAGKEVNEQMALEMRQIEKPNHCYSFSGITVVEMDCNMCKSRKCEKLEQEYVSNEFEGLLNKDEPEPEREVDDGTE